MLEVTITDGRAGFSKSFLKGRVTTPRRTLYFKATHITASAGLVYCAYNPETPQGKNLEILENLRQTVVKKIQTAEYDVIGAEKVDGHVEFTLFDGFINVFIEAVITAIPEP